MTVLAVCFAAGVLGGFCVWASWPAPIVRRFPRRSVRLRVFQLRGVLR